MADEKAKETSDLAELMMKQYDGQQLSRGIRRLKNRCLSVVHPPDVGEKSTHLVLAKFCCGIDHLEPALWQNN